MNAEQLISSLTEGDDPYRIEHERAIKEVVDYFVEWKKLDVALYPGKGNTYQVSVPDKFVAKQVSDMVRKKGYRHRAKYDPRSSLLVMVF